MGQCNCSYWHGLFGGVYLYHLRKATFDHIIEAAKLAGSVVRRKKDGSVHVKKIELYRDKTKSILIENNKFSLYVDPARGGIIRELDYKDLSLNLTNTLKRTQEDYHSQIEAFPSDLSENGKPVYDSSLRGIGVDRFFDVKDKIVPGPYTAKVVKDGAVLSRNVKIGNAVVSVVKKIFINKKNEVEILYTLKNKGAGPLKFTFGSECNITMPYLNSISYSYRSSVKTIGGLNDRGSLLHASSIAVKDITNELDIDFTVLPKAAEIVYFPGRTASRSESGFEINYQATTIIPKWRIEINRGKEIEFGIRCKVEGRPKNP